MITKLEKAKAIIEAVLFAAGRSVKKSELAMCLEIEPEDVSHVVENMKAEYKQQKRGIEIVAMEDGYQLCSKQEYYEYIYQILDKRSKPNLSTAALETLAIIAYNPKITRAEIEAIRGVSSDGTIYKLLEYSLIEEAGRLEAPGRPTTYQVGNDFFKLFGYSSLEELPELPKYKIDENEQIVIEDIQEEKKVDTEENIQEAPSPERETEEEEKKEEEKRENE